jgi:hypothetical protein
VKAYYQQQYAGYYSNKRNRSQFASPASIIALLRRQGTANAGIVVITLVEEWSLFRLKLTPAVNSTSGLFTRDGGAWSHLTARQQAALVDVTYNTGSPFSTMVRSLANGDLLQSAFNLVNARRTTQVGNPGLNTRTEADLQMLLYDDEDRLGQLV